MEYAKIIAFAIAAACVYGIAHDLVTAHVCVEYFLPPAHPIIIPTNSPLALALIWGVVATWWVGLLLGVPLAAVCRMGRKPKLTVKDIKRPVFYLLVFLYVASMLLGVLGYIAGNVKLVGLLPPLSKAIAPERHNLFLFDLWAHGAAYFLGVVGGIVLMRRLWMKRRFLAENGDCETTNQAPVGIARSLFLEWRSPRRGTDNPQDMTNDVWKWIIETKLNGYQVNKTINGPSPFDAGPCWCFDRFGQTETTLPDGRIVYVAGEHEDFYDPDFFIYNDVVIVDTSGNVQILGYPSTDFPPTDFHSATLVGNDLILIGNLGYPDDRRHGQTQVLRLNTDTFHISPIETSGESPGWIHEHTAELSSDCCTIRITGGKIDRSGPSTLVDNIDEWNLDLQTGRWKRLTRRQWPRFVLHRKDEKWNHLLEMRNLAFWMTLSESDKEHEKELNASKKKLKTELGSLPDLKLLETLYEPDVATENIAKNDLEDDEYGVYRIRVGEVTVRYVEGMYDIKITVEGELPLEIVEKLKKDLMDKFAALERKPIICLEIPPE